MDTMVLRTQQYLNLIYGGKPGYERIPENGKTGWTTIYALTRALQIELGITNTADNFGPSSERKFKARFPRGIAQQGDNDETTSHFYAIIQGALWCKGYSTGASGITEHFYGGTGNAVKELKKDAGMENPNSTVTLNVMKALLSMNQYVTLKSHGGTDELRSIQQSLNRNYEAYIGLSPCDGLYGREMNKALIKVLQAIEGLSVSDATGNFGNQTKKNCPLLPDTDGKLNAKTEQAAIRLVKYALCCNGYSLSNYSGEWTIELTKTLKEFQKDLQLEANGIADINTWMSLLLSKGNPDRACVACDTRFEITESRANILRQRGYTIIGRYLTGGDFKELRVGEPQRILDYGFSFFPIFQESGSKISYFTKERGKQDANTATQAAVKHGIPDGAVIYFAVDFDAMDGQIEDSILPYFKALSGTMKKYRVGVYGTRNVCTKVCDKEYAVTCFVSDMSTGYSGNMGYRMPKNWNFDQFNEIDLYEPVNGQWGVDKDAYSGRFAPVTALGLATYQQPEKTTVPAHPSIQDVIPLIEELEDLYVEWYSQQNQVPPLDAKILAHGVTNYLRHEIYNSLLWKAALGASNELFWKYVEEKDLELKKSLLPYMIDGEEEKLLSDGHGGVIDLKHLAATAEGYFYSSIAEDSWYGWLADLATVIIDAEVVVDNGEKEDFWSAADFVVGNSAYRFAFEDICSDADAIKISELVLSSSTKEHAFSEAIKSYYSAYWSNRYKYLVKDIQAEESISEIEEKLCSYNEISSIAEAFIAKLYSGKEESRYKEWIHSTNVVECCCASFAKYIGSELGV